MEDQQHQNIEDNSAMSLGLVTLVNIVAAAHNVTDSEDHNNVPHLNEDQANEVLSTVGQITLSSYMAHGMSPLQLAMDLLGCVVNISTMLAEFCGLLTVDEQFSWAAAKDKLAGEVREAVERLAQADETVNEADIDAFLAQLMAEES